MCDKYIYLYIHIYVRKLQQTSYRKIYNVYLTYIEKTRSIANNYKSAERVDCLLITIVFIILKDHGLI